MENYFRNFVKIIREICDEESIMLESYSFDWIFRLYKDGLYNYIIGYQFGLNVCSVHSICCDKSAASEIMTSFNIPNVEHVFFMSPVNPKYVNECGNWKVMMELLSKYGKLVCKSNEGTGGNQVYCVKNQFELENATYKIFKNSLSMAICPYYEIDNEYRVIVLNGDIKLIYMKQRPYITGDGVQSVRSLISNYIEEGNDIVFKNINEDDWGRILEKNEIYYLNWKHNLGKGSYAIIEESNEIVNKIEAIIKDLINKMNIKFSSIDIVKCNNEYKVLEINSGVMMEHFSQQDGDTYIIAKEIYREAILSMFE